MTEQSTTAAPEDLKTNATPSAPGPAPADGGTPAPVAVGDGGTPAPVADKGGAPDTSAANSDAALQALREQLAGGDEAMLKQLARYKSVDAISKGFRQAYNTAKNGQKPPSLSDKSTPEEIKAYREAHGIPENAADYPGDFREGFVDALPEAKEILADFKAAMHEKNAPPGFAAAALDWYQDYAIAQVQQQDAHMAKVAKETQAALRTEWGGEYEGYIAASQQILTQHLGPEGYAEMMDLRLQDGSQLQDHLGFVKMMATIGADYFGSNGIMTGDVETVGKSLEAEKQELLALKLKDPAKYKSDEVQGRLAKIYAQLEKNSARR